MTVAVIPVADMVIPLATVMDKGVVMAVAKAVFSRVVEMVNSTAGVESYAVKAP